MPPVLGERRKHSLIEILGVAALVAAVVVLAYRDFTREADVPAPAASASSAAPADPARQDEARRKAFELAYAEQHWGKDKQGKGTSGFGSTLEFTKPYRAFLQDFMARHAIRSVVDAGCGAWESAQAIDWRGIDYLGIDIVEPVIKANQERFGAANIRFAVADMVRDELPPADLLIVKDVLQHLSNADITRFLAQLPRYRHVLLVNDVHPASLTAQTGDIRSGEYRQIDPTQPPHSVAGTKVFAWHYGGYSKLVVHVQRRP
jgi:SAM-dependent methyltransferase